MNQKLSDWASIAEIVSGLAVVVTLVILIIGIRENTNITRMSMYADQMAVFNDLTRDAYRDEQLTAILDAFLMEDLSTLELMDIKRLENAVWYVFRNYESAYIAHEAGYYGEDEWERMERHACLNFERAITANFEASLENLLTRSFFQ